MRTLVAKCACDQCFLFSTVQYFRPDYGLLLELHTLTQVACSYVSSLVMHVSCVVTCPAIPEGGGGGGGEQGEPGNKVNIGVNI